MGITIRDLLLAPHLGLSLYSGAGGLDREAVWTHTSDLPDPWHWLSRGDLLLTNGMSFPDEERRQVQLVEELQRVGACALAIGEMMYCPPLAPGLRATSDRLKFPIIWVRYPMPFSAISRLVAEETLLEQSQRLMRTARIYDVLRRAAVDLSGLGLEIALSEELRSPAKIYHRESGRPFYPGEAGSAEVLDAVRDAGRGVQIAGARSVVLDDGQDALIVDIPTHDEIVLVVSISRDNPLDGVLLQHAATVVALEISRLRLRLEHERRGGAEMLSQLLGGSADPERAGRHMRGVGLDSAKTVLAAVASGGLPKLRDLHVHLWRMEVPHVVVHRQGVILALVPDGERPLSVIADFIGTPGHIGVSARLGRLGRAPDAYREARWALGVARRSDLDVVRYGESGRLVGFTDADDARALVDRCLSSLIDYDREHQSELLTTLDAFLMNQRSWQTTAEVLSVHRQTVLYRMRKVEKVTGRRLADTAEIAELWMALRARDLLRGTG